MQGNRSSLKWARVTVTKWAESLRGVYGQDTLLSQCPYPPRTRGDDLVHGVLSKECKRVSVYR